VSERDAWATPAWLTALLPHVDLDPCSNPFSTVKSSRTYSLEAGQDGLALPWDGSVYVNPPFSNILPWAYKLGEHGCDAPAAFLVNADHSTLWWRELTVSLDHALMFRKRIQFNPPPGIKPSTNNKAQALLMNEPFLALCQPALFSLGALWQSRRAA